MSGPGFLLAVGDTSGLRPELLVQASMGRVIDCSGISDTCPEKPVRFVRGRIDSRVMGGRRVEGRRACD